ncbi:MAG: hypothetical protein LRY39_00185 [Alphaproteobacteria bacterium]|nr:hypothetical protein [Alphaproteobacteria bacterium]
MTNMIKILGFKRVLILSVLLALNVVFGMGYYSYLQPQTDSLQQQLSAARNKLAATQDDIQKMQVEFSQIEQQQGTFNRLKAQGFLGTQGRRQAEIIFGDIQRESGVVSAVANVRAANVQDNDIAAHANYALLVSPVDIEVQAMDDTYINRYLSLLFSRFPGALSIDSMTIKRTQDINNPVLRAIVNGQNVAMVSAKINLSWRTMISQEDIGRIRAETPNTQDGGRP